VTLSAITLTRENVVALRRQRSPKRQTRRVIKPQPPRVEDVHAKAGTGYHWFTDHHSPGEFRVAGPVWAVRELGGLTTMRCPYGGPGSVLYVKEHFAPTDNGFVYHADLTAEQLGREKAIKRDIRRSGNRLQADIPHWRSSRFMPRAAAREAIEIVEVRAQRVQDITGEDARAEGVLYPVSETEVAGKVKYLFQVPDGMERAIEWGILGTPASGPAKREPTHDDMSRLYFSLLWDKINGKRAGCSWNDNPWVWALTFERVTVPRAV
jgi:hypothetical protein